MTYGHSCVTVGDDSHTRVIGGTDAPEDLVLQPEEPQEHKNCKNTTNRQEVNNVHPSSNQSWLNRNQKPGD